MGAHNEQSSQRYQEPTHQPHLRRSFACCQGDLLPELASSLVISFDVTDEALYAVAKYLVHTNDIKVFTLSDGHEIHLRADMKEPSQ